MHAYPHMCSTSACMHVHHIGGREGGKLLLESIGKCLYDSRKVLLSKQVQEESAQTSSLCFLGLLNHTATVSPSENTHS